MRLGEYRDEQSGQCREKESTHFFPHAISGSAIVGLPPAPFCGPKNTTGHTDGQELFYRGINGRQMFAVPVETQPTFTVGNAEHARAGHG